MKEAFELIKERLGEAKKTDVCSEISCCDCSSRYECMNCDEKQQYLTADKCIEIVSEVEAEYGNGWIDVKDRLPEKDGYYLTCDHKGNIHIFFHSQEFKETAPFGICEHHSRYYQPIAWMELPKPYTGKKGV